MRVRRALTAILAVTAILVPGVVAGGCGGGDGRPDALRVGLFLNITHGPALIGLDRELANGLAGQPVEEQVFASGPEEVSALLGGSLDAGYLGPGPYVLAESRAPGRLRLLAGVMTGGQALVARSGSGITSVADLRGRRVAVPARGNTQDLALRLLLGNAGLRADDQGGDVTVVPVKSAALPEALTQGVVDAALAPEPYAARLVGDDAAMPVPSVNRTLTRWRLPSTVLVVTEDFARRHPAAVRALVAANAKAVARAQANPQVVAATFNRELAESTGKEIDEGVLLTALGDMDATTLIAPGAMRKMVDAAGIAGYLGGPVPPAALVPRPG